MRRGSAPFTLFALAAVALFLPVSAQAKPTSFGLSIALVREDDVTDAWLKAQIDHANTLYALADVRFRWTRDKILEPQHGVMHTRADRDALSALTEAVRGGGFVDVFVVDELEDVDEPGRLRRGVVWTHRPDGKRYVILARTAAVGVLAHELGHFFGNPHVAAPDNLMSYTRTGADLFLDDSQIAKTKAFAKGFLTSGRLRDVGEPTPPAP